MIENRRFERINDMIAYKSYMKHEDMSENEVIFAYGFQHIKTDKIDKYILIGFDLDEIHEKDRVFNFSSEKIINEEIEMRDFKITERPFLVLVKNNNASKIQSVCD